MIPSWLTYARTLDGVREIPGPRTNPTIASWLHWLKAAWTDDATPWCGTFVAHVMQHDGRPVPKHWYRALEWAEWGTPCKPVVGAVGVKKRYDARGRLVGGHVFFCVGKSRIGSVDYVHAFGGNQRDMVCTMMIKASEIIAYRWPSTAALASTPLPDLAPRRAGGSEA